MEFFFTTYIYQPFLNILVGIYWIIGKLVGEYDMGLAVIVFAVVVRIIMLPLNFAGNRSAREKQEIADKIKALEKKFKQDPVRLKQETKKTIKSKPKAIISETIIISIQVLIVLILYRIFRTGLKGEDLHLLYNFIPSVPIPINLMFLGEIDLSKSNLFLNIIQSILIFVLEMLKIWFTSTSTSRKEFISLGVFLPLASFVLFAFLPSGKKLFIITSLIFSIFIVLIKQVIFQYQSLLIIPPVSTLTEQNNNQDNKDQKG